MKTRCALLILGVGLALLLGSPLAYAIPDWSFDTLPASGDVEGPPGSTVGWGYTISNPDPVDWLVLTGISADPFLNGSPLVLFDFPNVAPDSTLTVPYDGVSGLYQLTWEGTAPVGFVDSGTFILSAEWFDGDPLAGGIFLEFAPDRSARYSATVASASVPEPLTWLLLASGLGALGLWRRLKT